MTSFMINYLVRKSQKMKDSLRSIFMQVFFVQQSECQKGVFCKLSDAGK